MSTAVRKPVSLESRTIKALVENENDYIQSLKVLGESKQGTENSSIQNSSSAPGGNFLPRAGGTMLGAFGNVEEIVTISGGIIDVSRSTGVFAPYIILNPEGGVPDSLDTITPGEDAMEQRELWIEVFNDVIAFTNSGNIVTPDALDLLVNPGEIVKLIFSLVLNAWIIIGISGEIGANKTLSNLDSPTAINQSLLFSTTGFDIGDTTNPVNALFAEEVRLQNGTIVSNKPMITSILDFLTLNTPLSKEIDFRFNGVSEWLMNASRILGDNLILNNTLNLNDGLTDPSSNGQFTRNGTRVKVMTNNVVKDLSDILAGADKTLSNLDAPTSINQNLIPQAGKLLGDSGNPWSSVWTNNLKFGTAGVIDATINQILADAGGLTINSPSTKKIDFAIAGTPIFDISASRMTGNNLILSDILTLNDTVSHPGANGDIYREGTDVKIFSGGLERNLSDLVESANKTLSNLTSPTSINQDLLFSALGFDIGDATFPLDNLFVEQVRLREGTVVSNVPMITRVSNDLVLNVNTNDDVLIKEANNNIVLIDTSSNIFQIMGGLLAYKIDNGTDSWSINKTPSAAADYIAAGDGHKFDSKIDLDQNNLEKVATASFYDGFGNLVGDIRGINASPDILEIRLGSASDFAITDNGTVRADFDNTLLTWSFQGANLLKLPQETLISDRTSAPSTPPSGQMSLYVINVAGAQTFKVKFDNGTEKTIVDDT